MKKLNVKWLPETFATVSLTISATSPAVCKESDIGLRTYAPGKLIIISDGNELSANVATLQ